MRAQSNHVYTKLIQTYQTLDIIPAFVIVTKLLERLLHILGGRTLEELLQHLSRFGKLVQIVERRRGSDGRCKRPRTERWIIVGRSRNQSQRWFHIRRGPFRGDLLVVPRVLTAVVTVQPNHVELVRLECRIHRHRCTVDAADADCTGTDGSPFGIKFAQQSIGIERDGTVQSRTDLLQ